MASLVFGLNQNNRSEFLSAFKEFLVFKLSWSVTGLEGSMKSSPALKHDTRERFCITYSGGYLTAQDFRRANTALLKFLFSYK